MMVSFCAVLFSRGVFDGILDLTESDSEGFPTYSFYTTHAFYSFIVNNSFYLLCAL